MTLRDVMRQKDAVVGGGEHRGPSDVEEGTEIGHVGGLDEIVKQMEGDIHESWRWNKGIQEKLGRVRKEHKNLEKTIEELKERRNLYDSKLEKCRLDNNDIYTAIQYSRFTQAAAAKHGNRERGREEKRDTHSRGVR